MAERILITGVANFWGQRLAERLLADGASVVGLDTRDPAPAIASRIDHVRADLRAPDLPDVLAGTGISAVVHNDVPQFPEPGRSARQLHDINVIGTLQLLAALGRLPEVRALVVRGSAAIYGSEPGAPAFFTEDMDRRYPLRTRWQRDVGELERLVDSFARRTPEVVCCVLRLQPVLGSTLDTPITRLFRAPVVPTHLGFDPRIQVVHEDDSIGALHAAVRHPARGAVNVAGEGTVSLSRMLRKLRRPALPLAGPLFGPAAGVASRVAGLPLPSDDVVRYLRYGRGVDTTRLVRDVGFTPRYSTAAAIEAVAADVRDEAVAA
ncbi:NAD-dependent epimerase/dehydratase family protein [Conexibacter sp. SYSU D00693]|uniref:NAD-dependent epimerase/dehydratase family protein n=1 Tax=Conexibacter sp. SYSU D00693 TaxID=2812560 RepID=UPI00196B61F8|nr:NAD-dependent epimerase/dehydratase family protein [Conexibacter sp. SYSU D00693]